MGFFSAHRQAAARVHAFVRASACTAHHNAASLQAAAGHYPLHTSSRACCARSAGTNDQRLLILSIKSLVAGQAMMVVDTKGNLCYSTSQLAALMVG